MNETSSKCGAGLIPFGVILSLGLIVSAGLVMRGFEKIKLSKAIAVKGMAERRIVSDMAVWRGSFVARDATLVAAYGKLEKDSAKVLAFLDQKGVPRDAVSLSAASTMAQYQSNSKGQPTATIEGYLLTQTVEITSTNIALISKLARESTALIQDGIEFASANPEFFYTKLNDLKLAMLGDATKDAWQRADRLASSSGSKVGVLRSAHQGIFQITPVNSTEVSDGGINDTTSVEKKITAVVTVEYSIR